MENLKDKLTNIAAILIIAGGSILGLETKGVIMPLWLQTSGIIAITLGGAIIGYFTGKKPDGTVKAESVVVAANIIKA